MVWGPDNNVIVNQDGNNISGEIQQSSTRISEIPENEKAGTEEPNSSQISRKELCNVIRGAVNLSWILKYYSWSHPTAKPMDYFEVDE